MSFRFRLYVVLSEVVNRVEVPALPADEKGRVIAGIREGRYRLLYVSPERLAGEGSDAFLGLLSRAGVSFLAVDEAHCISQWGHDFRPEYRQLGRLRAWFAGVSLHAFTATATARVRGDIATQLGLRDPVELVGSFDRPNLVYRVLARATLKRQILDVLIGGERSVGDLACLLGLAQPQVSKHLRVLREVGAVDVRDEGRRRLYRLNGAALKPVHDWVKRYERTWAERFELLDDVLEDLKEQEQ